MENKMNIKMSSVVLSISLALCSVNQVMASESLGKKQQDEIIKTLADALEERYVLAQEGSQFANQLRESYNAGIWENITDKRKFVESSNTHLYQITRGKHVTVRPANVKSNRAARKMVRINPNEQGANALKEQMGLPPGESITTDILLGNIGLLTINDLMGSVSDIHQAMAFSAQLYRKSQSKNDWLFLYSS